LRVCGNLRLISVLSNEVTYESILPTTILGPVDLASVFASNPIFPDRIRQ